MTNAKQIEIEQRIVRKYLEAMRVNGYTPVLQNYGDGVMKWDASDLFAADEMMIWFDHASKPRAMMYFVYGNEPGEVLSDYSVSIEDAIKAAAKYAEQWA